jgi:hypothetical protein
VPRSTPPSSDVDRDIGQLFALRLGEFTAARNALAARLKKEGNAEGSARVKGLARPTISAWAVNQVFWRERASYDRLLASGDALREVQQRMLTGRQGDLREVMRERQDAARAVVEHSMRFLRESGNAATDATRQRVAVTVDALAAYGSAPQGYAHGRLERDLDPPGIEALGFLSGARGTVPPRVQGGPSPLHATPPNLRLVRGGAAKEPAPHGGDAKTAKARAAAERAERERHERERREHEKQQRAAAAAADRELAAAERAFERAVQAEREAAASPHEQQRNTEALRRQLAKAEARLEDAASDLEATRATRERAGARRLEARRLREALRD